ncbi:MAG: ribosome silencing factor [Alphaproteobacteria bacterium]|nr:ribosome silencing factor [Alphaproteobacteria bacterium]
MEPRDLLDLAVSSLEDDKAEDIVSIDLQGKTSIADYMVIASGRSERHLAALSQHLIETLKKSGLKGVRTEGEKSGEWALIDAGDVIIHIFKPDIRTFYNLEKLWNNITPEPASIEQSG